MARHIEFLGEIKTASQWAEVTGIPMPTIVQRLRRGWSIEDTLTIKPKPKASQTNRNDQLPAEEILDSSEAPVEKPENNKKERKRMNTYEILRGDIFYIEANSYSTRGSEQWTGRPAVIVSNDHNNKYANTVEVVYLTTQPKKDLPTHTTIYGTSKRSTTLCEQISTIDKSRIGDFIGRVTGEEMEEINKALLISLGIEQVERPVENDEPETIEDEVECMNEEYYDEADEEYEDDEDESAAIITQLNAELLAAKEREALMRDLYDHLLKSIIGR